MTTITIEMQADGTFETIYPCHCRETHRGPWAAEQWHHHTCLHETALLALGLGHVCCPDCGRLWSVEAT